MTSQKPTSEAKTHSLGGPQKHVGHCTAPNASQNVTRTKKKEEKRIPHQAPDRGVRLRALLLRGHGNPRGKPRAATRPAATRPASKNAEHESG